jgi:hypothetical protein
VIDSVQWFLFGVEAFELRSVYPYLQTNKKNCMWLRKIWE